jgi:hypothetical protein
VSEVIDAKKYEENYTVMCSKATVRILRGRVTVLILLSLEQRI